MSVLLTGGVRAVPKPSSTTPGDVITWDDKEWLVCHYANDTNRVYLISKDIISMTVFGSDNVYAGSTLAQVAMDYQTNQMSAAALAQCVDVTVNGVTAKVFVPSSDQMTGGFSWFNSEVHRIAKYNGTDTNYWTSSAYSSQDSAYYVKSNGNLSGNIGTSTSNSYGFRPCICVQM